MSARFRSIPLLPSLLACATVSAAAVPASSESRTWHACDEALSKTRSHARLMLTPPTLAPENSLLSFSTPAEAGSGDPWFRVIFDPHEKFYKAWYGRDNVCYGTSHNGLLWNKPLLSFHPDEKGERTSMLLPNVPMAAVWRDDADSDEKRLFKMVGIGTGKAELRVSANGIEWSEAQKLPDWGEVLHPQAIVTPDGKVTSLYWHRASKKGGSAAGTDVLTSSSTDRLHWSAPQPVAEGWLPGKILHSFAVTPCGSRMLLMAGLIDEVGKETTQAALAGASKQPEDLGTMPELLGNAQSAVQLRDAAKLYFTRTINGFHTLNLATFPPSGLCGLAPDGSEPAATLITQPLPLPASESPILRVTASVETGGSVEIVRLNDAGQPEGSPAVFQSGVSNAVAEGMSPLSGKTVQFQITLKTATLHTLSLAPR